MKEILTSKFKAWKPAGSIQQVTGFRPNHPQTQFVCLHATLLERAHTALILYHQSTAKFSVLLVTSVIKALNFNQLLAQVLSLFKLTFSFLGVLLLPVYHIISSFLHGNLHGLCGRVDASVLSVNKPLA